MQGGTLRGDWQHLASRDVRLPVHHRGRVPRAITLRGLCEEVAVCTLEHISHSPACSTAKTERELGYVTAPTMQVVAEHLRALGLLE